MSLSLITKDDFNAFVDALLPNYRVAGPVAHDGCYAFESIRQPDKLCLDYPTTILPPKKFLLPIKETIFQASLTTDRAINPKVYPPESDPPTVIFGVHNCDIHAIQLLDRVFSGGNSDPNYTKRRAQTVIFGIECLRPCDEHSFCKSMDTLSADDGYDVHMLDLGEVYALDIATDVGAKILERANMDIVSAQHRDKINAVLNAKWPRFSYRLEFDVSDLAALLDMSMKSKLWNELGERCLSCAACTNVCPTCFCFNVTDEVDLPLIHGQRVRTWDSCQLDAFATVTGGHDFRSSRTLRQRHRFMRKGKYIQNAHGYLGCVGCGRCARACLVDITPVKVFNELYRRRKAGGMA